MAFNSRFVARTAVDPDGFIVGKEHPSLEIGGGGVAYGIAHGPGWLNVPMEVVSEKNGAARRHHVIVLVGVEDPANLKLFEIVDTRSALRFLLRLGQHRQKHARENGNNGNYD